MSDAVVHRDERTTAVENASYRLAYMVLTFGLLLIVAYRSFVHQESPWDLLGLVIVGGLFTAAYQAYHHVLTGRWVWVTAASFLVAFLLAAGLVALR
jgi:RsiW-degrading membrane proteinase PrsW (M82 family)